MDGKQRSKKGDRLEGSAMMILELYELKREEQLRMVDMVLSRLTATVSFREEKSFPNNNMELITVSENIMLTLVGNHGFES